jgi:hypothetical protein
MANEKVPNDASAKSKAEGERWQSDSETVERYDERSRTGEQGGGITNRPIGEEVETQASLPDRGDSREGAHAGHGDRKKEER